jgi:hypothetical protein
MPNREARQAQLGVSFGEIAWLLGEKFQNLGFLRQPSAKN